MRARGDIEQVATLWKAMATSSETATVSLREAADLLAGEALFLDVREQGEWDLGHVPDALHIPRATFRERVGRGTGPVKARIMDQAVLAGVGNLLADEALWRARLDPRRAAGALDEAELDRLWRAIRAATRDAIAKGGVHTGRVIAHRAAGERCPRCGAPMQRATVGGRTTWWCSREQR